ncbi:CPBP family intramembrane metalloprotease [Streptomyces sp. 8K308]|uniref:CPBP family intramembrane glutamic endopeptidase n=1 Tax=Streptomyces sp. 8K308 TaxID=2530388 RepID=UPI0010485FE2|nr:CPBP family intramembrane glutamic endopeptidase [Streptomyces sp. 8K308]TDC25646.1 CPBP family intramembrane metalloprotease [Streptomyces sp. 8K308]
MRVSSTGAGAGLGRRVARDELLLVLALSLGASAVSALISFTGVLTRPGGLGDHAANLNSSRAPDRPWLDLAWQLFGIATALVPVLLVAHFLSQERGLSQEPALAREGGLRPGAGGLRVIGFDAARPRFDLAWGAVVAAGIGGSGLMLYLGAHAAGASLTVVPESLPEVWWKFPVLILSAIQNSVVEEVIVVGFLLLRLERLGWSPTGALVGSAVLRGTYHLYQGIGGFFGNVAMGVIFVWLYRRWGRVMPLVVAHALIDIVAFVGYALLAGRVDWLPTA